MTGQYIYLINNFLYATVYMFNKNRFTNLDFPSGYIY